MDESREPLALVAAPPANANDLSLPIDFNQGAYEPPIGFCRIREALSRRPMAVHDDTPFAREPTKLPAGVTGLPRDLILFWVGFTSEAEIYCNLVLGQEYAGPAEVTPVVSNESLVRLSGFPCISLGSSFELQANLDRLWFRNLTTCLQALPALPRELFSPCCIEWAKSGGAFPKFESVHEPDFAVIEPHSVGVAPEQRIIRMPILVCLNAEWPAAHSTKIFDDKDTVSVQIGVFSWLKHLMEKYSCKFGAVVSEDNLVIARRVLLNGAERIQIVVPAIRMEPSPGVLSAQLALWYVIHRYISDDAEWKWEG